MNYTVNPREKKSSLPAHCSVEGWKIPLFCFETQPKNLLGGAFMTSQISMVSSSELMVATSILSQWRWHNALREHCYRVFPASSSDSQLIHMLPWDLQIVPWYWVRNSEPYMTEEPTSWFHIWWVTFAPGTDRPLPDKCQMTIRSAALCHILLSQNQKPTASKDDLLKHHHSLGDMVWTAGEVFNGVFIFKGS